MEVVAVLLGECALQASAARPPPARFVLQNLRQVSSNHLPCTPSFSATEALCKVYGASVLEAIAQFFNPRCS